MVCADLAEYEQIRTSLNKEFAGVVQSEFIISTFNYFLNGWNMTSSGPSELNWNKT